MQERVSNRSQSRGPANMLFMMTQRESEYSLPQAANHISPVQSWIDAIMAHWNDSEQRGWRGIFQCTPSVHVRAVIYS